MVYITTSNAQRIIYNTDLSDSTLNGPIYKKPIYMFNKYEEASLLAIQELLKDPSKFFTEIYKPIKKIDSYTYVFEGQNPAYHFTPNCERLHADFTNFEIPRDIRIQGKVRVTEFRDWFKVNMHLLDKPDIFVVRMNAAFGVQIEPRSIKSINSGVAEFENLNLDQLEDRIDKLLRDAGSYYYASEKNRVLISRFSKFAGFLSKLIEPIQNNDTEYSDEEIKEFLRDYIDRFKKPLKKLLVEYYRVKHNPDLKLEGNLLEQLGFVPCYKCSVEGFKAELPKLIITSKQERLETEKSRMDQCNEELAELRNRPRSR